MVQHQFSLYDLTSGRTMDDDGWRDLTDAEYDFYVPKFREFLLSTCRAGRMRDMIKYLTFSTCTPHGIYKRLIYEPERDRVEYVAGQDYPGEIRYIKNLLMK